ncbi:hypothetical protein DSLASN_42260 [Desulfoluna limicola]|uniref:Uncharacterized protein n=1 Tax=Desulfoluna limicola TaxID=2810562 RepID=A0ABN6F8F0_9BACT|nr:hypothetical protein DSLASN_42260 [Desulfoluna limicola]
MHVDTPEKGQTEQCGEMVTQGKRKFKIYHTDSRSGAHASVSDKTSHCRRGKNGFKVFC